MSDKKKDRPFVFLRCLTYNHEKYIEDALKGFVMQKTDFPFLAVVIDDCSTDGTADIVRRYEAQYPDIIKGIYLPHNFRSRGEDKRPYYQEYIDKATYWAECEGDDYWTDPLKLQKQVDILEADGTLMACCTDCSVVDKQGVLLKEKRGGVVKDDVGGRYNLRDFFRDNHQYPTLSVVYRCTHTQEVRQKYAHTINAFLGDWTLWICLLIYGDMYFLNEVTCAYRINPTSLTHTVNRVARAKANREICKSVADILPDEYADIAADLRDTRWVWISLIFAYKAERRYLGMMGALIMSIIKCPRGLCKILKDKIK
ncbi:MAG: glycosyltransferase [Bacteroidales bacterium]|nr:glycosyltransferase [Bacteroidales bacterium]